MNNSLNIDLVEILGLENLPLDKQKEIIEKTGATIFNEVMHKIIPMLNDTDKEEFGNLMSNPDNQDAVYNFLKSKINKFDQVVEEVVAQYKSDAADLLNF